MRYSPSAELALMRLYPLLLTSVLLDHLTGSWLTRTAALQVPTTSETEEQVGCYRKMPISTAAFWEGVSLSGVAFRERAVFSSSFRGGTWPLTQNFGLAFTIVILNSSPIHRGLMYWYC